MNEPIGQSNKSNDPKEESFLETSLGTSPSEPPSRKKLLFPKATIPVLIFAFLIIVVSNVIGSMRTGEIKDDFYPANSATRTDSGDDHDNFLEKIEEEFWDYADQYGGVVSKNDQLNLWWVSFDGLNIINDSSGVILEIPCSGGVDEYKEGIDRLKNISEDITSKLQYIMKTEGYVYNPDNSSDSFGDLKYYDYIQAYEKTPSKCALVVNPDCGNNLNGNGNGSMVYTIAFSCTDDFEKNYEIQAPYLKDLEIKDSTISFDREKDGFVRLNVNGRRSGHYIIAKFIDGKWMNLVEGQDYPSCEKIDALGVPQEIYLNCWVGSEELRFKNL